MYVCMYVCVCVLELCVHMSSTFSLPTLSRSQSLTHVRNDYGNLLKSSGRVAEAKQCYTSALSQQPALAVAWNNLGCVSLDEADGTAAIAHFSRAIYYDCRLECAYTNLVNITEKKDNLHALQIVNSIFILSLILSLILSCFNRALLFTIYLS